MTLLTQIVMLLAVSASTDDANAADIDQWARTLRIQVYDTFRSDRAEFDRRRQQADRILAQWKIAGQHPEDRTALINWLERAVHASQPGSIGPLPGPPRFGSKGEVAAPIEAAPETSIEPPAQTPSGATPALEQPAPFAPQQPAQLPTRGKQHAPINMVELSARLTGYNRGVRAVEIKLSEGRPCTTAELSAALDDLAELARRGRDLSLYREHLITQSERENLPTPVVLTDAMGLLGDRIFSARQNLNRGDLAGTEADRQGELDQLNVLSRRLAEIAAPREPVQIRPASATP